MAAQNVIAQVVGGQKKILDDVSTVADVRRSLGLTASYKAAVNGEPAADSVTLRQGDYVSFSEAVKGA